MKTARQRAAAKRRIKLAQRARRKVVNGARKRVPDRRNPWSEPD